MKSSVLFTYFLKLSSAPGVSPFESTPLVGGLDPTVSKTSRRKLPAEGAAWEGPGELSPSRSSEAAALGGLEAAGTDSCHIQKGNVVLTE